MFAWLYRRLVRSWGGSGAAPAPTTPVPVCGRAGVKRAVNGTAGLRAC